MFDIPRVAEAFYSTPWAILPSKLDAMAFVIEARQEGVEFTADDIRAATGGRPAHKQPSQSGSVATIPVYGVISKRMDMFAEISGGTSTDALVRSIQEAVDDPSISAIVLDVDSPGGSVNGPEELSQAIFAARGKKPIIAVVNELMASAAYWIASAADEIVTAPTAGVGSIGVLSVHRESSKADAARGVKTTYIHAGKYKVAGNPAEPLSDESRAVIQERVDAFYSLFVNAVARNRGVGRDKALAMADGRLLIGQQAIDAGMADRIGTLQQVISELVSGTVPRRQGSRAESTPKESIVTVNTQPGSGAGATNDTKPAETAAEMQARIRREEIARGNTLRAMCNGFWPHDSARANQVANLLIDNGSDETAAKVYIFDQLATERKPLGTGGSGDGSGDGGFNLGAGGTMVAGRAQAEKFTEIVSDGLALRLLGDEAASRFHWDQASGRYRFHRTSDGRVVLPTQTRTIHSDANIFRGMRLMDIAKEHLRIFGVSTRGMSPGDIAKKVLGWDREGLPMAVGGGGPYQRSGDFPHVLMDAVNKTLLMGYSESPATWRQWARTGDSVPDFKNIHRIRMGEGADLEVIPSGNPFPEDKLKESRETYAVETRGKAWSFTREMLINDDMNAFSVYPTRYARAAERTINRAVYGILIDNPTMSDGIALFHSSHANVLTSGAAPSVAELNSMQKLLRLQTGLNTDTPVILNTAMRHLIVPATIEGGTLELLQSPGNPAAANGNSAVKNIWQGRVNVIVEALLDGAGDANPTTRYFGLADNRDIDTVEVTFLQGEETPVVEEEYDFETKGRKYTIHQTFGAKAIDWRGMVRNKGTA